MRLKSYFPDSTEQILNAVEIESTGATEIITSHYAAQPFGNKPEEYWGKQFVSDYVQWCMMIGIRTIADDVTILDVKSTLVEDYPIHNEISLKTCLKMNLKGILGEVVEPFGQLNRVYLTKVMTAYEKKLQKDHKRAIEIRDALKQPEELTDHQKELKLREAIFDGFNLFKKGDRDSINLISYVEYDYFDKNGILKLTKEQKNKYMQMAKAYLSEIKQSLFGNPVENTESEQVIIAKRYAVRDYYNSIQKLPF